MIRSAEYLWLDGAIPTQQLRSKTRYVTLPNRESGAVSASDFPAWSFDGSSTGQADGGDSDCNLAPVRCVKDPLREGGYLVLCEVLDADGNVHATNSRASLRSALDAGADDHRPFFGFEQEYTLFRDGRPLGWPEKGFPGPQGPFYCGVGSDAVFGRELVEEHAEACIAAGLLIYGTNAEVMPGQWEYQIGYRGDDAEMTDGLVVADHLWISRFLLHRLAERRGISVSLEPKPVKGDWNGAGAHTNFSTAAMRADGGMVAIENAIERLEKNHESHIREYGASLGERLTGLHETCSIDVFKNGVADRGASIRIPRPVADKGRGYLEDRRPGANCDPYRVCALILSTVCGEDVASIHETNAA